jgi:NAD(P)-dependent dehydrogenase (short-subunit alcohol dehydrogenase family)
MKIEGCAALVTGANRGLGKAYADALLAAGGAKVYAGARDISLITDKRLIPVKLDITAPSDVAAAAKSCEGVRLRPAENITTAGSRTYAGGNPARPGPRDGRCER